MSSEPHKNEGSASPDTIEVSTEKLSSKENPLVVTIESKSQVVSITEVEESGQESNVTVTGLNKIATTTTVPTHTKTNTREVQGEAQVVKEILATEVQGEDVEDAPAPDPELLRRALESLRMQQQSEKVEVPVGQDDGKDGKYGNTEEVAVEDGMNKHKIVCPFCFKSTIFLPKAAKYVKKSIFLPYPGSSSETQGENYEDHFEVTNQMQFENISVKRSISSANQYQYLTCCDCDGGPVGIMYRSPGVQPVFYIAHKRIKYVVKKP